MYDNFFGKPYVFFKGNLPIAKIKHNSSCEQNIICLFTVFEHLLILLNQTNSNNGFINRNPSSKILFRIFYLFLPAIMRVNAKCQVKDLRLERLTWMSY